MAAVSSPDPFSTTTISNERPRSRNPVATSRTASSSIPDSLWAGRTTVRAGGTPVGYRPRDARTSLADNGCSGGGFAVLWLPGVAAAHQRGGRRDRRPAGVDPRSSSRAARRGPGNGRPGAGRRRAPGPVEGPHLPRRLRGGAARPAPPAGAVAHPGLDPEDP